ncbi:MAG: AAA family ATPase, partial [Myxococcota bacterium]|nr:AAA family ATPase [Myxococcota bacterium]
MAPPLGEIPGDLAELVFRCLEKAPEHRPPAAEVVQSLRDFLAPSRERLSEEEGPFRGLEAFTERHAGYFHGRDAEIGAFLERLRTDPILPVVGPSGAGKSSFVQAGVVPRLREQGSWTVLTLRPGGDPFHTLATRLLAGESTQRPRSSRRAASDETPSETVALSRQKTALGLSVPPPPQSSQAPTVPAPGDDLPEGLASSLRDAPRRLNLELQRIADASGGRVLLFIDQLEELHTHVDDPRQRRAFMQAICTAADDPEAPVRVVFTLRDDFLGRLAVGPEVREVLGRVAVLRSPAPASLEEILTRPLTAVGYSYDDRTVVAEMLDEIRGEPACLPLLQFTARLLWDRRDRERRLLRRATYRAAGGVAGALADHAQSVLAGLTPDQTADARDLLLRLVTTERTRRRLPRSAALDGLGPGAEEVLGRLIQARLLTVYKGRSDA